MGACRAGDSGVTPGVYNVERRILTVGHYQVLETLYRHGRSWMGRSIYSLQLISFPDKAAQQHSNRDPGGPAPAQRRHRRCRAQILRVRSRRRHRRRCCRPVGAAAGPFAGGPGCSSRSLRGPFALPVDWRHGSVRSGLAPLRRGSFGMQEISAWGHRAAAQTVARWIGPAARASELWPIVLSGRAGAVVRGDGTALRREGAAAHSSESQPRGPQIHRHGTPGASLGLRRVCSPPPPPPPRCAGRSIWPAASPAGALTRTRAGARRSCPRAVVTQGPGANDSDMRRDAARRRAARRPGPVPTRILAHIRVIRPDGIRLQHR